MNRIRFRIEKNATNCSFDFDGDPLLWIPYRTVYVDFKAGVLNNNYSERDKYTQTKRYLTTEKILKRLRR